MNDRDLAFLRQITRRKLFEIWLQQLGKDNSTKCRHVMSVIIGQLNVQNLSKKTLKIIQKSINNYCTEFAKRWQNSRRSRGRFLEKNFNWLNQGHQWCRIIEPGYIEKSEHHLLLEESELETKDELDRQKPSSSTEIGPRLLPSSTICRLCLNACTHFTTLCEKDLLLHSAKNIQKIKKMIGTCMPTFDLALSVNPIICDWCLSQLKVAHKFISQCLSNQDRIKTYKENHVKTETGTNLNDVLQEMPSKRNHSPHITGVITPSKHTKSCNDLHKFCNEIHDHYSLNDHNEIFDSDQLDIDIKEEPIEIYNFSEAREAQEFNLQQNHNVDGNGIKQEANILDKYEVCQNQNLEQFTEVNTNLSSGEQPIFTTTCSKGDTVEQQLLETSEALHYPR